MNNYSSDVIDRMYNYYSDVRKWHHNDRSGFRAKVPPIPTSKSQLQVFDNSQSSDLDFGILSLLNVLLAQTWSDSNRIFKLS